MPRDVILVVDDDASSCETLSDILELKGYAVLTARTGEAAEAVVRSRPVDAALLDLRLPDRSGLEVLRLVKDVSPDTEVLMISGYPSLVSAIKAMRYGAFGYILKPVNPDEVLAAIKRALERQRMAQDLRQANAENRERVQELELLLATARVVSSRLDLTEVLHALAEQMVHRLQVTLCRIFVLDDDRAHLTIRAAFPAREVPLEHGVGGRLSLDLLPNYNRVVGDGEVVLLRGDDPQPLSETEVALAKGAASALLVPMMVKEQIVGVVTLLEARAWDRSPFTQAKVALCQAMASGAAIALENALLFADREKAHLTTLAALVSALDARERETQAHSLRVQEYTLRLAREMGSPEADLKALAAGALLHDIGKIGIPDAILLKPGELIEAEWQEMRRHPQIGGEILKGLTHLEAAGAVVLAHQERWDGSGYPRGLAGTAIPPGARIFAVADALDAMTSDRPYRRRTTFALAREEIARCAGTQFDPEVVAAFLRIPVEEWEGLQRRAQSFSVPGSVRLNWEMSTARIGPSE